MRSTPDQDERLRTRLEQAVDEKADGSADKLGRMLGYTNGGYIREAIAKTKPVRRAIIDRFNGNRDLAGWFDAVLSEASKSDVSATPPAPWPLGSFLPQELWQRLSNEQRVAVAWEAAKVANAFLEKAAQAQTTVDSGKRLANGK